MSWLTRAEVSTQHPCDLVCSAHLCVELDHLVRPRRVPGTTSHHIEPGRFSDEGKTAVPAAQPSPVLPDIWDHEVHKVDVRPGARGSRPPGLSSLLTVVDSINDDAPTQKKVQLRIARVASYAATPVCHPDGSPKAGIDSSTASMEGRTEPKRATSISAREVFPTPGRPEITMRCPVTRTSAE